MATNDINQINEQITAIRDAEREGSVTNVMVAEVLSGLMESLESARNAGSITDFSIVVDKGPVLRLSITEGGVMHSATIDLASETKPGLMSPTDKTDLNTALQQSAKNLHLFFRTKGSDAWSDVGTSNGGVHIEAGDNIEFRKEYDGRDYRLTISSKIPETLEKIKKIIMQAGGEISSPTKLNITTGGTHTTTVQETGTWDFPENVNAKGTVKGTKLEAEGALEITGTPNGKTQVMTGQADKGIVFYTRNGHKMMEMDGETLTTTVPNQHVENELTGPTIDGIKGSIKKVEQEYARKDGAYEGLLAGSALNLQGRDEAANSSMYRTAGGQVDIASGLAEIMSIRGESRVWNQLATPADYTGDITSYYWLEKKGYDWHIVKDESHAMGSTQLFNTDIASIVKGHKYVLMCKNVTDSSRDYNGTAGKSAFIILRQRVSNSDFVDIQTQIYNSSRKFSNLIFTAEVSGVLRFILNHPENGLLDITLHGVNLFDLTLIYGAGNEPSTPEQFEADYQRWFGKPLTSEPYNEGVIYSAKAEAIRTVGFNLSAVERYSGWLSHEWNGIMLFKNDCGYTGRMNVSLNVKSATKEHTFVFIYYTDGTHSSLKTPAALGPGSAISTANKVVDRIVGIYDSNEQVEITDICISFSWSGVRDGEYEPHWQREKALPLRSLKGRLGGEGEPVAVFPDGMKRAGSVYDEIKVQNGKVVAVKRVGSVDLGELEWSYQPDLKRFLANVSDSIIEGSPGRWHTNIVNGRYKVGIPYNGTDYDKIAGMNTATGRVYITDTAYTDAAAFKAAVKGVMLYYELAEPQEYELEDFELPMGYDVDDFGTEQIVSPEGSVAPTLMTRYAVNAVDTLRRLPQTYISLESMDAFLSRLSAAMNGKWTRSWNEQTHSYDFTFTPGAAAASLDDTPETI